jgi:crotonobetainyl-CoA:carnitine CoA-transferase CaiB-like acyl-CoA transferase
MLTLLKDIRVLEVSTVVMGPLAGQILADLGAEVVKVESLEGDGARASYPQAAAGMGALYVNNNRNKKVIALDLKSEEARPIIERMIARSDVLLHNMRPESAERLGIGFDTAARINPRIVYCSAIGFGQAGRYRNRAAYDDIVQAVSGLAGIASGEEPRFIPTILADKVCALHAVYGILASLVARAHGREGAIEVQVPMFEAMVSFVLNEHLAGATFSEDGKVGYPRILSEHRRPHRTRDGWIAVLPYTGEQWRRFLVEIGRPEICQEPWFVDAPSRQARIHDLYSIVSTSLVTRTTAEWIEILSRLDVPCSEVNRLEDLLHDPHLADVDFFSTDPTYPPEIVRSLPQPVQFHGIDKLPDHAAPALGAHTREILQSLSFSDEEIDKLAKSGIVREHQERP